jgi:hypothetical protein
MEQIQYFSEGIVGASLLILKLSHINNLILPA